MKLLACECLPRLVTTIATPRCTTRYSSTAQEAMRPRSLDKGVIRTTEYGFRSFERVYLTGSCLPTSIKVFHQPITLCMKRRDVLRGCHQLVGVFVPRIGVRLQGSGCIRLRSTFLVQRLGIGGALCCRVGHQLLVVGLRVLLLGFRLGYLLVQILDQQIDHGYNTTFFI